MIQYNNNQIIRQPPRGYQYPLPQDSQAETEDYEETELETDVDRATTINGGGNYEDHQMMIQPYPPSTYAPSTQLEEELLALAGEEEDLFDEVGSVGYLSSASHALKRRYRNRGHQSSQSGRPLSVQENNTNNLIDSELSKLRPASTSSAATIIHLHQPREMRDGAIIYDKKPTSSFTFMHQVTTLNYNKQLIYLFN